MTFSLVACDLDAREWGVAVASKFLAVGAVVPWARGDVGAVATQSYAKVGYGPDGLEALAAGRSAQDVIDELLAGDDDRQQRQVGLVDHEGGSATFTGVECADWAGGRAGDCFAAQGNTLAGAGVVDALADTFTGTAGPLVERLLAALAAADAAGGDRRGRQSACVITRRAGGGYGGDNDIVVDLRVDDHPDPVTELQRLYAIHDLLFGTTPPEQLIPLEQVRAEVTDLLARLGHGGDAEAGLRTWAGAENFEMRLHPGAVDPVVLAALRRAASDPV